MDNNIYEGNVKHLCSQIYSDVFHEDYYDELDGMFDLFVEQGKHKIIKTVRQKYDIRQKKLFF